MRIQDEERRRIARELHDDLGQVLTALKLNLDMAPQFDSRSDAIALTQDALSKVRNLSYLMHPPLLDESGLLAALHVFFEGFKKRSKLRITFDYKPIIFPRLPAEIETSVFRVVQEAITNVHRHSRSDDARVEVYQQADRVYVRVRDFGVGMPSAGPMSAPIENTGVGLSGMRERIKQIGGEVKILAAEPGTLVEAMIPLFQ